MTQEEALREEYRKSGYQELCPEYVREERFSSHAGRNPAAYVPF